jgi:hypothetical protein
MDKWKTKDGREILIKDLEDSHLMNIIKLIERNYAKAIGTYLIGPGPSGEMAQDAFDREFDKLNEEGPYGFNESYEALIDEADKREIDSSENRKYRLLGLDITILKYYNIKADLP